MARKPRVHYEGAVYHIITRGNNREQVFHESADKKKYLEYLKDSIIKYEFLLYGYVLMDNHIHMLARVANQPLAKPMQSLQQRYTQYYNDKYKHSGHVFQQRYKAFLCTDESYLLTLICYIHQNPLRAGIIDEISFPWSSHNAYARGTDSLVNVDFVLNCLHENREIAIRQYLELVKAESKLQEIPVINDYSMLNKLKPSSLANGINVRLNITYEELIDDICTEFGISQGDILSKTRARKITSARNKLIYEAISNQIMTQAGIADRLNIDASRVSRVYQQMKTNKSIVRPDP